MPRRPRERSSSGIYHIMIRGINKQSLFESNDDRYRYLATLNEYADLGKFIFWGYCLMDNHIHLLIKEAEDDISTSIKRISASYVFWYNKKYERCGHLFQERFKSEIVEGDINLLRVLRYIHQNPLKAGLCNSLREYEWSSYNEYVKKPIIVNTEYCLNLFSQDREKAIILYKKYMYEDNEDRCLDYGSYKNITDQELRNKMTKMGISNINEIQHLNMNDRNNVLLSLKNIRGVTLRQLARMTGISKSLIGKL